MTRLAWITPGYPPDRGGVSDHSCAIVSELQAGGHEVLVCSKPHERGFKQLDVELAAFRPESVVVAYVPLGFAPRTGGISPAFTFWSTQVGKRLGASTLLLAHEVSLPAWDHLRRRELKLALLGAAQLAQFEVLVRAFDRVVFSHEGTRHDWVTHLPRFQGRLNTVRISSNIPVIASADPAAELAAAGYSVPSRTVLFFGSGHQSVLFDYVEEALICLLKVEPEVRLVIVGMDAAQLRKARPTLCGFGSRVQALGFVASRDVSLWLQVADLVLAPLAEGVTARRTTVMAPFQHGRAVVTTSGVQTRSDIPWARICAVAPVERSAFAATALKCFQDPDWRAQLGAEAQADYDTNASASVTAAQLLAYASRPQR